jgi:peptidylprolyl isomerase
LKAAIEEKMMRKVQLNDVIRVHYTGRLEDGTEFDSSTGKDPLEFKVGGGNLISGFEEGVIGMTEGETKSVSIPPEEGYGEHQEELVAEIERSKLPATLSPEVGMPLQVKRPDGQVMPARIVDVSDDKVTLDGNPPLAGKTLIFDMELVAFV